ncbi:MAG: response regulator [Pseudobacteriovorax sp.]|nr:response regulator [Pseudobacteriovorax sp.]
MLKKQIDPNDVRSIARPTGKINEGNRFDFGEGLEMILAVQMLSDRIWIKTSVRELLYSSQGVLTGSTKDISKIIVADDDDEILATVAEMITEVSPFYLPFYANNGADAEELIGKCGADLIITDNNMPKKEGIAIIEDLRKSSNVPVIFHSANLDAILQLKNRGFSNIWFLSKPADYDEFIETIISALSKGHEAVG